MCAPACYDVKLRPQLFLLDRIGYWVAEADKLVYSSAAGLKYIKPLLIVLSSKQNQFLAVGTSVFWPVPGLEGIHMQSVKLSVVPVFPAESVPGRVQSR